MRKIVFICMVNPVLLGLICTLLDYFTHINYKILLIGATGSIVIGLSGLVICQLQEE